MERTMCGNTSCNCNPSPGQDKELSGRYLSANLTETEASVLYNFLQHHVDTFEPMTEDEEEAFEAVESILAKLQPILRTPSK